MQIYKRMIGCKIVKISRTLDLIMFAFEDDQGMKIYLHLQCFFRMFRDNQLALSSWDLYRPNPEKTDIKFEWDEPGSSLFDYDLDHLREQIYGLKVESVVQSKQDLFIRLSNHAKMEILIDTTTTDEQYRIFDDSSAPHYVIPPEE